MRSMRKGIRCFWGIVAIVIVIFVIQNNILPLKKGLGKKVFEVMEEESESETEIQRADNQMHFAGVIVPQKIVEINKDEDRKVKEVYVKKGDKVKAGQKLFAYDTSEDEAKINQNSIDIENAKTNNEYLNKRNEQFEKQKKITKDETDLLTITTSILMNRNEVKQNEYNIRALEKETKSLQERVDHSIVVAESDGIIVKISESEDTLDSESANTYMTIIENGNFRVCGTIKSEGANLIYEGMSVIVHSRVNKSQTWKGSITEIVSPDSNESGSGDSVVSSDGDSVSTDYKFYVEMENADGLILGQHVYMTQDPEQTYVNNDFDVLEVEPDEYIEDYSEVFVVDDEDYSEVFVEDDEDYSEVFVEDDEDYSEVFVEDDEDYSEVFVEEYIDEIPVLDISDDTE